MGAPAAKFTFDLDLTRNQEHAAFLSDAARASLQAEAHAAGRAEGIIAGERTATAMAAQTLAAAASAIADRAATLLSGLDATRREAERDALELSASIARKLAAGLLALQPATELETLLVECLASLEDVPHLVIRCHPDLAEKLRDLAAPRIAQSGFTGRLIVMGEPDIALGDGRIEWAEGGLVRDSAAITAAIDARIADYLDARGPSPLTETFK